VTRAAFALRALVDEIEEAAQLVTRGWQVETGAPPLTAPQQQVHDLGMTAGMQATVEVLCRRGLLHLADDGDAEPADPSRQDRR
jgi:hypothetical protein